jgi:hypothetical protein
MPDELDAAMARFAEAAANPPLDVWQWQREFVAFENNPFRTLAALNPLARCPHRDLAEEYSRRVLAAGLGEHRLVVRAPNSSLYEAFPYNVSDVRVKPQKFGATRPAKWSEKPEIRQKLEKLLNASEPGQRLTVGFGSTDHPEEVSATWIVYKGELYENSVNYRWGSRQYFVNACAVSLNRTP